MVSNSTTYLEILFDNLNSAACNMWYCRITEYNDIELPSVPAPATPRSQDIRFGAVAFGPTSVPTPCPKSKLTNSSKRKLSVTDIEEVDDIAHFKRVRVISKKSHLSPSKFYNLGATPIIFSLDNHLVTSISQNNIVWL